MKERPIIFNGDMVRAILDGRKTMTRRPVKPQPIRIIERRYENPSIGELIWEDDNRFITFGGGGDLRAHACRKLCPFGQPGDRLWVRETWSPYADEFTAGYCIDSDRTWYPEEKPRVCVYRADHPSGFHSGEFGGDNKWHPSIHMPRWASRITLEITGVRVERVQDVRVIDALAEGISECGPGIFDGGGPAMGPNAIHAFMRLWNSIYSSGHRKTLTNGTKQTHDRRHAEKFKADYSWASNPWAWVIEFRRVKP